MFVCAIDSPRITTTPQSSPYITMVGAPLLLYCTAEGVSTPQVQWYENGTAVTSLIPQLYSVLTIVPRVIMCTCVATNTVCGQKKASEVNITVIVKCTFPVGSYFLDFTCAFLCAIYSSPHKMP